MVFPTLYPHIIYGNAVYAKQSARFGRIVLHINKSLTIVKNIFDKERTPCSLAKTFAKK